MKDHFGIPFQKTHKSIFCLLSVWCKPKLLSSFLPQSGAVKCPFLISLGLILGSFVFISVFRNLCTSCSFFQTPLSLLVGCLWDNWIWELNLQFVIENGTIRWLQIRTLWHITRGLFRVLWGEMEQMMSYPDLRVFWPLHDLAGIRCFWLAAIIPLALLQSPRKLDSGYLGHRGDRVDFILTDFSGILRQRCGVDPLGLLFASESEKGTRTLGRWVSPLPEVMTMTTTSVNPNSNLICTWWK